MASLYDEKVLGAKERLALARKLQEQGDNVAAGQMVSGWYVPNTGAAITGAIKNIIGGYKEGKAQEDLDKAEMTKNKALANGLLQAGLPIPQEMRDSLATPEQTPSWGSRLWAGVTGGEQPQTVPRQEFTQQPAKDLTPDQRMSAISSLIPVAPEYAAPLQAHEQFMYGKQQDKENKQEALQNRKEIAAANAEERATRAEEQRIFLKNMQGERLAQQEANIRLVAGLRQNQGGNQDHYASAGVDPYTGEPITFNRQTGQYFKTGPTGALIPIGGASTPPPTGAVPPPANVPTGAVPPPTGAVPPPTGAVPPPTGAVPPPTGAPPQQPNGAMGGPSAPRLYSPEQNATFSQLYKNQLSGINPRVSTKIQPAYLQWQKDNGLDPSDIVGGTAEAKSRAKTALDYTTSGNSGKNIMRIATAVQHVDVLKDAYKALENGDIPAANSIFNRIAQERGMAPQTSFGATAQMVAPEIAAAVLASGGATALGDRQDYKALLNGAISPAQFKGLIQAFDSLFGGRVKTLATEYKLGTGKDFNYAGHNLSRFAPKEETPAGTPPPAGQGGWSIRRKGQ
jgi:hypothetical protein